MAICGNSHVIIDPALQTVSDVYKLMIGVIVPRPIAFVSTVNPAGRYNLAPFSFFMGITSSPPTVAFSPIQRAGEKKDTLANVEATGEFVINVVNEYIAPQMCRASGDYPAEVDEFQVTGLTPAACAIVKPPRVKESPVSMECRVVKTVEVGRAPYQATPVAGEIVLFHIRDDLYRDGQIDLKALRAVGRLAGDWYCRVQDLFAMKRPVIKRG